jgi:hypothetical protein
LPVLTNNSTISFPLTLKGGRQTIRTVGDAADYFSSLSAEQRDRNYWSVAIKMFKHAIEEHPYLTAATISLQTALLMDGLLESPLTVGGK